jgi:hypothetical protein
VPILCTGTRLDGVFDHLLLPVGYRPVFCLRMTAITVTITAAATNAADMVNASIIMIFTSLIQQ